MRHNGALAPYMLAIRAHPVVVLAVTVIACTTAVVWHGHGAARYGASAKILVTPLSASETTFAGVQLIHDSNDPTRTIQTAASLIGTPQAAQETARRVGRGYTRERLEEAVNVRPEGQSNIIAVTVEAPDPELAARLADTYATVSLAQRDAVVKRQLEPIVRRLAASQLPEDRARGAAIAGVLGDPTLSLSQPAFAPATALGAPSWLVGLLSLVAGFIVAAAVALLMEQLDRRVRREAEFTELYPIPVLTRVPKARDRLVSTGELTTVPHPIREAYRTLQVQVEQLNSDSRVIMVTSGSPGDGKTSAAINLGLALVAGGHRVLLIDLDVRQPDMTRALGMARSPDIMRVLTDQATVGDLIVDVPPLAPLAILPGGRGEGQIMLLGALARRLPSILEQARERADYVIIDTAPLGLVSDALHIVPHVDEVLVVARPGVTQRPQFQLLRDLLARAGVIPAGIVMVATTTRFGDEPYPYGMDVDRAGAPDLATRRADDD